jgi:ParB family chromosome partitioning protein
VDKIIVGHRHRNDLGDLDSLAHSIAALGLLQPIVLLASGELVAGRRRLEAVRKLGHTHIDARVVSHLGDALALLRAERDENTCRKEFTPSEAVAVGEAIEALEQAEAARRQQATQLQGKNPDGQPVFGGENFSAPIAPAPKGRAADKAAAAVGMSRPTYQKAKAVATAAGQDWQQFGDLVRQMDETDKVDPAYRELLLRKQAAAAEAKETLRARTPEEKEAEKKARRQEREAREAERKR